MKINATDFSEESEMLSSDAEINLLIFSWVFERAALNAVTNQMPQLQVVKVNFNLTYSSYIFTSI